MTEPAAGNYYPLTAGMYIQDQRSQLALLTDRAQGELCGVGRQAGYGALDCSSYCPLTCLTGLAATAISTSKQHPTPSCVLSCLQAAPRCAAARWR